MQLPRTRQTADETARQLVEAIERLALAMRARVVADVLRTLGR